MSQTLARFLCTSRRLTSSSLFLPKCTHSSAASAFSHPTHSPPVATTHHLRRLPQPCSLPHAAFRSGASFHACYTATRWLHSGSADVKNEGEEEMAAPPAGAGCSDRNRQQLQYCLIVLDKQQLFGKKLFEDSFTKMNRLLRRIGGVKKKKKYLLDFYVRGDQAAFGCKINTETAKKLKGMPEVANVIECSSEPASHRGGHSDLTTDFGFENKQPLPYWLIRMGHPCSEELTEQQKVDFSMMKLVPILDSLDILITEAEVAFGCEISKETAKKLKGVPGIVDVSQSSRTHSVAYQSELLDNSCSDEEMADFEPLPQFPSSFSDVIGNQDKKLNHWIIYKEKIHDRGIPTERKIVEYSLQTLAPVLSDGVRREKGVAPKIKLELAFYLCDDFFVFGLDMEDESASKLKVEWLVCSVSPVLMMMRE